MNRHLLPGSVAAACARPPRHGRSIALPFAQYAAGFSYLELVIVIATIGVLIAVATNRLVPYVAQAERVAVMRLEAQLRNVLVLEAAQMIARGQSGQLALLDHANPMALVLQPPANYLGEMQAPAVEQLPARSWHFDTSRRELVYLAGSGFALTDGQPVIHDYFVKVAYEERDGKSGFSPGTDEFYGLRLVGPGLRLSRSANTARTGVK